MELDAEVSRSFDLIVRNPQYNKTLFAVPNAAVPLQDYATALHASSLIADGGTLQIGIGCAGRRGGALLYPASSAQREYRQRRGDSLPPDRPGR